MNSAYTVDFHSSLKPKTMKKLFTLLFIVTSLIASAQCTWPKAYNSAKYLQFQFDKQGEILGQFSHDNFASSYNHVGAPTTPTVPVYNESCAKYSSNGVATWMFNENYGFSTIIPFDNGKFFLGSFTSRILDPSGAPTGITFPTSGYTYHEGFSDQLLQFNGTTLNAIDINTGSILNTSSLPALSTFIISSTYVKGSNLYLIGRYFSTTNYANNVIIQLNSSMTVATVKTTSLDIRKMAITNPGTIYLCLNTEIGTFNWTTSAYATTEVTGYSALLKYDAANARIVFFNAGNSTVKFIYDSGALSSYPITVAGSTPTFGIEVDYFNNELLINGSNSGPGGGTYNGSPFPYLATSSYANVVLDKISMQRLRASFVVRNQNICPGSTIRYYSSSTTGNPTNYNWSFPGGSPSTSTLSSPMVTYCNAGLYNASLTVSNCNGTNTASYTNFISVSYSNCSEPGCAGTMAQSFGGTNYESALAVRTDAGGNIYTTGQFKGTVDFDPSAGVSNLTSTTANYDVYISKFDAYGNFVWVKQLAAQVGSSSVWNKADDMVFDDQGNLYLSGTFAQTVDFDPGSGVSNLTSGASAESFVLKLNTCGDFIWAKQHGGSGAGTTTDIAIDNANNIYIAGPFANTINIGPFVLTGAGNWEGYVARMNTAGTFLWAKRIGSFGVDYFTDVKTNSVGSVVLTGLFNNTVDFDPNAGVFNMTSAGSYDAFVLTLDASGNFVWAKRTGNTGDDAARELVINNTDDIIAMGDYTGVVDFDPNAGVQNLTSAGGKDVYVQRLTSAGNYAWAGSMGSATDNYGRAMSIDGANNVYVSGDYSSGTLDVDPTAGVFNLGGTFGSYISKINTSNAFVWGKKIDGAGINAMWNNTNNDLVTAGSFLGTADFDINAGVINLSSNGNTDAFIAKYCASNLLRVAKTEEEGAIATSAEALTSDVLIYPNPSLGQVFVTVPAEWNAGKITVYNSVGQIVMTGEVDHEHKTELSLESLKDGLYFINVSNGENSVTEKLIKNTTK
jgi:hypothetical protein